MNDQKVFNELLLLIDIQNDYFPGGAYEVPGSLSAAAAAGSMLAAFRRAGKPIVHVRHLAVKPGSAFFLPDTHGSEFHTLVQPLPMEPVVVKHFPNAFRGTNLQTILQEGHVKRLIIAGMMTHMCIDATTRAAFDQGYECSVVGDACAAPSQLHDGLHVSPEQVQAAFLAALSGSYATIIKAADTI